MKYFEVTKLNVAALTVVSFLLFATFVTACNGSSSSATPSNDPTGLNGSSGKTYQAVKLGGFDPNHLEYKSTPDFFPHNGETLVRVEGKILYLKSDATVIKTIPISPIWGGSFTKMLTTPTGYVEVQPGNVVIRNSEGILTSKFLPKGQLVAGITLASGLVAATNGDNIYLLNKDASLNKWVEKLPQEGSGYYVTSVMKGFEALPGGGFVMTKTWNNHFLGYNNRRIPEIFFYNADTTLANCPIGYHKPCLSDEKWKTHNGITTKPSVNASGDVAVGVTSSLYVQCDLSCTTPKANHADGQTIYVFSQQGQIKSRFDLKGVRGTPLLLDDGTIISGLIDGRIEFIDVQGSVLKTVKLAVPTEMPEQYSYDVNQYFLPQPRAQLRDGMTPITFGNLLYFVASDGKLLATYSVPRRDGNRMSQYFDRLEPLDDGTVIVEVKVFNQLPGRNFEKTSSIDFVRLQ